MKAVAPESGGRMLRVLVYRVLAYLEWRQPGLRVAVWQGDRRVDVAWSCLVGGEAQGRDVAHSAGGKDARRRGLLAIDVVGGAVDADGRLRDRCAGPVAG